MLQSRYDLRQMLEPLERNFADVRGFERLGGAMMSLRSDRVEAEHLARQKESGDVHAPILGDGGCLEHPAAHRIQRAHRVAGAVERLAFANRAVRFDQVIETL